MDLHGPHLYGCDAESVSAAHNIQAFVRWCQFPNRSAEQIEAVLKCVFALRHLSHTECDRQWLYVVRFPPLPLFKNYSMTVIPCKVHPCHLCQKRQGGIMFTFLGPWTPPSIMTGSGHLMPPIFSLSPVIRWQDSVVGTSPWRGVVDIRPFELIDADLRTPLYEDVIVVDEDQSSPTELSSLTEDDAGNA